MELMKQNQAMEEGNQAMKEKEREAEMARLWERTWQEEKRKLEKCMNIAWGEQTMEKISEEKEQLTFEEEENKREAMIARSYRTLWQEEQPKIEKYFQNAYDQMDEETCVPIDMIEETKKPKGVLKRFQRRIGRLFRQFCFCLRDDSI
jgi:hypothetical protein